MLKKVWFHRSRAIMWCAIGVLSFVFGWQNSVVLVWIASLYANIISDWTAAEAADDRVLLDRITCLEAKIDQLLEFKVCHHGVVSDRGEERHVARKSRAESRADAVPLGNRG